MVLIQDYSVNFGGGDYYEQYQSASNAQSVFHSFDASGSSFVDVVHTESTTASNWWYMGHFYDDYVYDTGGGDDSSSSTPTTSPTEFVLIVYYPDVVSPATDAVINLAIKPDWEANLGYVDANGFMDRGDSVEDLLLKDFAAGKGPAQGAEDDQLAAKSKLRTGDANQPDLREGAKSAGGNASDLQTAAGAADAAIPVTGSQAKGASKEVDPDKLAKTTGESGGDPNVANPTDNSGSAKTLEITVKLGGPNGRIPMDPGYYLNPDYSGSYDRDRDVIEFDYSGKVVKGIDDLDISEEEKQRLKEKVAAARSGTRWWDRLYYGTADYYRKAGMKVRIVKTPTQNRGPKTNTEAVVRGAGEALGGAALAAGAVAVAAEIATAAGGIALAPEIAIGGGIVLLGLGLYGSVKALLDGIHIIKRAENPGDLREGVREATAGGIGVLGFGAAAWKSIRSIGARRTPQYGKGCFPKGTLVATERGSLPIDEVVVGDNVWAYCPHKRTWELAPVEALLRVDFVGELVTIHVGAEAIESTGDHPYWVIDGPELQDRPAPLHVGIIDNLAEVSGRWVDASCIRPGDLLLCRNGDTKLVTTVAARRVSQPVYNFTVSALHTFAVGAQEVLVHNRAAGARERLAPSSGSPVPAISRGPNRSRVRFRNVEVRAVRDLSHVSDGELRAMSKHGFAPKLPDGRRIDLHHHRQNPNGPIIEIPTDRHDIWNRAQHPHGNTPGSGLPEAERAEFDEWRQEYWKARARDELTRRGLI